MVYEMVIYVKTVGQNIWRNLNCKILGFHRTYTKSPNADNAFCTWCDHEIDLERFNHLKLNEIRYGKTKK